MRHLAMRAVVIALGSLASSIAPTPAQAAPANDRLAAAEPLPDGETLRRTTAAATVEPGEPGTCYATTPHPIDTGVGTPPATSISQAASVWFRFSATTGETLQLTVPYAGQLMTVRAFARYRGDLAPVWCTSVEQPYTDTTRFSVAEPTEILVQVASARAGFFDLRLDRLPDVSEIRPLPNYRAELAAPIDMPANVVFTTDYLGYDERPDFPRLGSFAQGTETAWFTWRAERDDLLIARTQRYFGGASFRIEDEDGTEVAISHSGLDGLHDHGDGEHAAFHVVAGSTYRIGVTSSRNCCALPRVVLWIDPADTLDIRPRLTARSVDGRIELDVFLEGHDECCWDTFGTATSEVRASIRPVGVPGLRFEPIGVTESGRTWSWGSLLPGCAGTFDVEVRAVPLLYADPDVSNNVTTQRIVIDEGPTVPACLAIGTTVSPDD